MFILHIFCYIMMKTILHNLYKKNLQLPKVESTAALFAGEKIL